MKSTIVIFVLGLGAGAYGFHYFTSTEGKAQAKTAVHTAATVARGAVNAGETAATK